MNARLWRRWSLNTYRMSSLWLATATLLLLIICAPTTTTTTPLAMTTTTILTSRQHAATATATATATAAATAEAATATAMSNTNKRRTSWRKLYSPAAASAAAAAIPASRVGGAEESFYIPVAASREESSNSNSNSRGNSRGSGGGASAGRYQQQPPINSPSSSKILSSSYQQQQAQQQQQQQQQLAADSIAYSYYYKTPATATATVFASLENTPAAMKEPAERQQHRLAAQGNRDYNEEVGDEDDADADADDEVADDEAESAEDAEADGEAETEDAAEGDSAARDSVEHVVDNSAAATLHTNDNSNNNFNNQRVPNVPHSQITNLHNTFTNTHTKQQQQQQQHRSMVQPPEANALMTSVAATNVHNTKARRHAQQRQQPSPAAGFHSPVRETATVSSAAPPRSVPPFRYIIEAFEVPATLPFSAEFTQQQRRMLLHKEQQRRLQLEQQQQAARNRRDSRPFGLNAPGNSYQQHFYAAKNQQQQQQQLQPYQRLQQQQQQQQQQQPKPQHQSPINNNYQKQHHPNSNSHQQLQQQPPPPLQHQHQHQHQHSASHQHQHQHQHTHQHQSQRNRRRRYCSARDPAQLAFEAPTVFEGKIISMTPDRRANFSATVEVKEIFKQQIGFRLQKYLRLQFAYRNTSGECDIYREQLRPRGLVRGDELEQGRIYLLFVQQIDLGNFTILGQPIRKTRRVIEAVQNAVSENYAQLAAIRSITASNRTAEYGRELRVVCKVQGRPPPKVTWFKDHKSINRNRRLYQIVPFKKRSELIIKSFNSSDAGRYECRAKNKVNRNLERRAIVIKAYPVPRYETHLTGGTGHSCPPDAAEFCFNGGTCKLFVEIGSYSCICPEGFIGERCDRKEVNNMPPSTYSNEQECGEKKFLGSYYC